jgi:DNA-binding response OmpR family regulator
MARTTLVLSVGSDLLLLQTRSELLAVAGYTVVSARGTKQALAEFTNGDFDLIILCHSLPAEVREHFVQQIRQNGSRVPVVQVAAKLDDMNPLVDDVVQNNPPSLLAGLQRALARAPRPARASDHPNMRRAG